MSEHKGEFAEWLRAAIAERGLSQNAVGERAKIGRGAISEYLSGKRLPDVETIERLVPILAGEPGDVRAMVERDRAAQRAAKWGLTAGSSPKVTSVGSSPADYDALDAFAAIMDPTLRLDLYDLYVIARKGGLPPESLRQLHEAVQEMREQLGLREKPA